MLGVSIVLYRSPVESVVATVAGLADQTWPPARIAIHVNSADADSATTVRDAVAPVLGSIPVDVTTSPANDGFAAAHNHALRGLFDAGCTAVVVLNPDLVLDPAALAALVAAEAELPTPALLGPLLELADPSTLQPSGLIDTVGIRWAWGGRHLDARQGEPMTGLPDRPLRVAGISGACLYVSSAAHDRVVAASGEFFDADFIAYREDAELAYRASRVGVASYLVPAARGRHARRSRGTGRGADPTIDRLGVRNRFLIAFKYGTGRPGGMAGGLARDVVVIGAVLTRERSSLPGLREAWRLRHRMRVKGRDVREFVARQQ